MRTFSFRPALTIRGRKYQGIRGFKGKPFHPPLTDIPIGAYVLAAAFDVASLALGSRPIYYTATLVITAGAAASVLAALTGYADWSRSTEKGTQARRTVNAHAWTMITVTLLVLADVALRWTAFRHAHATPIVVLALTAAAALLTTIGATIGGSLVFDYGFNVSTGGDHPVWHVSEQDVGPGDKKPG